MWGTYWRFGVSSPGKSTCSVSHAAEAGDTPAPPKAVKLTSPAVTYWKQWIQLRGGREERGAGRERGGARRDSLPLRCPVNTAARRRTGKRGIGRKPCIFIAVVDLGLLIRHLARWDVSADFGGKAKKRGGEALGAAAEGFADGVLHGFVEAGLDAFIGLDAELAHLIQGPEPDVIFFFAADAVAVK